MADPQPRVTIPTGFETQEALIALRQRLAEAMLQRGMEPEANMRSPLQVLGQWAQMAAGGRLEHNALNAQQDLNSQIRQSYLGARQQFYDDVKNGATPQQLIEKYGSNPFLEDDLKPYMAGVTKGQETRQEFTDFAGRRVQNGAVEGMINPGNPLTDKVIIVGGREVPNWPVIAATSATNPFNTVNLSGMPQQMPFPFPNSGAQPPQVSPSPAPVPPGVSPSSGGAGAVGRAGIVSALMGGQQPAPGQTVPANTLPEISVTKPTVPSNSRPPDGTTLDGRPYWMVNGTPYDNPDGQ